MNSIIFANGLLELLDSAKEIEIDDLETQIETIENFVHEQLKSDWKNNNYNELLLKHYSLLLNLEAYDYANTFLEHVLGFKKEDPAEEFIKT